jgi:hypothetical protein
MAKKIIYESMHKKKNKKNVRFFLTEKNNLNIAYEFIHKNNIIF